MVIRYENFRSGGILDDFDFLSRPQAQESKAYMIVCYEREITVKSFWHIYIEKDLLKTILEIKCLQSVHIELH